jgi:hypothetical protein
MRSQKLRQSPSVRGRLLLLRLGEQLPVGKASDVEAEEVEPVADVDDAGLRFAQAKPTAGEIRSTAG